MVGIRRYQDTVFRRRGRKGARHQNQVGSTKAQTTSELNIPTVYREKAWGPLPFPMLKAEDCKLASPIQNKSGTCGLACEKMSVNTIHFFMPTLFAIGWQIENQPKEATAWTRLNFQPEPPVTTRLLPIPSTLQKQIEK